MAADFSQRNNAWLLMSIIALGVVLVLLQACVLLISKRFAFDAAVTSTPILEFVGIQLLAGALFLLVVGLMSRVNFDRTDLILIVLVGLLMRLILFDSTPILEIDFYRYLWDGAVLANGHNPYLYPPAQAVHSPLADLARQSGQVIDRINYAELSTIYPPLTQLSFSLAYWLDSWNLNTWRLILFFADVAGMALIVKTLHHLNKPLHWSLIYWWNPLLIQQTYNAAHMDVLLVVPLMAAVLMLIARRQVIASALLAFGSGIKLWPLLLIPFALKPLLSRPYQLSLAIFAVLGILTILVMPLMIFGLGENSGLGTFASEWQRNSAIFPLLESVISLFSLTPEVTSRILVALILIAAVAYLNRRSQVSAEQLIESLLWVIVLLFLLSPAQFPWYTIWFIPLLCFRQSFPLLLLVTLMPIYYLKFYYSSLGHSGFFDLYLVWIQYLPPLGWLAWQQLARLRLIRRSPEYV